MAKIIVNGSTRFPSDTALTVLLSTLGKHFLRLH